MRVDSNTSRKPFVIDAETFKAMTRMANDNLPLASVASTFGVDRKTIKKAAEREGLESWLAEKFPPRVKGGAIARPKRGIQVPGSVQSRWLCRAWRVSP